MAPRIGDHAPGFHLVGVDGETGAPLDVALEDFAGRVVVLVFYPADDSPVCTAQLRSYTEGIAGLRALDAQVLAISPQDPESHERFAAANGGFGFPLLSDSDRAVARRYGVLGLLDLYRRSIFVIDRDGRITYASRSIGPGLRYAPVDELVRRVGEA